MNDHYFLLFGWGTFQVLKTNNELILNCTPIGNKLTLCHGLYKQTDHYGFEVTGFLGKTTELRKNNKLIAILNIINVSRWEVHFLDQEKSEYFYIKKQSWGRIIKISHKMNEPAALVLNQDPQQSNIFRPKLTDYYSSNIPLSDLYMALGFILCKNKL